MEAQYYHALDRRRVQCDLCPRGCVIADGGVGFCRVRCNNGGTLYAETFQHPVAIHVDPIEKKPLAFYRPGSYAFSVGTAGCNLGCQFCQNDALSRHGMTELPAVPEVSAAEIVRRAVEAGCESVALTYNEPTVFFEYAVDIFQAARRRGLGTVLVSNGYINAAPRRVLYGLVDAANIDIKGVGDFYERYCAGSVAPVWESCRVFKHEFGGHLEITNLLIPGANDSEAMIGALLDGIGETLGVDTPIHFSAYFPAGGFTAPPTPGRTLYRARELAVARGFERICLGNLRS